MLLLSLVGEVFPRCFLKPFKLNTYAACMERKVNMTQMERYKVGPLYWLTRLFKLKKYPLKTLYTASQTTVHQKAVHTVLKLIALTGLKAGAYTGFFS